MRWNQSKRREQSRWNMSDTAQKHAASRMGNHPKIELVVSPVHDALARRRVKKISIDRRSDGQSSSLAVSRPVFRRPAANACMADAPAANSARPIDLSLRPPGEG